MNKPGICQICLRTDKPLRTLDRDISDFHDELCDFFLDTLNPQYCMECGHMLKKLYNFHQRCKRAVRVYTFWKKTRVSERRSIHLLHELLPSHSLGLWTPNTSKVYIYNYDEEETISTNCTANDSKSTYVEYNSNDFPKKAIKSEKNCEANTEDTKYALEEQMVEVIHTNLEERDSLLISADDIKEELVIDFDINNINNEDKSSENSAQVDFVINDHCYVKNTDTKSKSKEKTSLSEPANISLSNADGKDDCKTEESNDSADNDRIDDDSTDVESSDSEENDGKDDDCKEEQSNDSDDDVAVKKRRKIEKFSNDGKIAKKIAKNKRKRK